MVDVSLSLELGTKWKYGRPHLTDPMTSPMYSSISSFGYFFALNFGGASKPSRRPNTLGSEQKPSKANFAEPVLQLGFHCAAALANQSSTE